jgi:hypothetical protein
LIDRNRLKAYLADVDVDAVISRVRSDLPDLVA